MGKLVFLALVLMACGKDDEPTLEEDCEYVCEAAVDCGGIDYTEAGSCKTTCESQVKCRDLVRDYSKCVHGMGGCAGAECSTEEADVAACWYN